MMVPKRIRKKLYVALALLSVVATGCNTEARDAAAPQKDDGDSAIGGRAAFSLPEQHSGRPFSLERHDFNGDRFDDAILMLASRDSLEQGLGFQRLELYVYSPAADRFFLQYERDYYFGRAIQLRDLNIDGAEELIVQLHSGGNSDISSLGMHVLTWSDNAIEELLLFESGAPQIVPLPGDDIPAVFNFQEFWPFELSRAEAVQYLDSIHVVAPVTPLRRDSLIALALDIELLNAQQDYQNHKDSFGDLPDIEGEYRLYAEAARCLIYLRKLGQSDELEAFAAVEDQFWQQALPEEYGRALNAIRQGDEVADTTAIPF